MGLQFYVGEIQAQINEATRMNSEAQQAISTLQTSISQFLSAPLSGKAYTSAKNYFSVAFTPLCRSAIMTGEALAQAHKKLLSEYQGSVSSIDTNEDEILEQINQFEQLKRSLEEQMRTAKTMRPDLEKRYMNACDCIKQRREKLQKFEEYHRNSESFFSEFDSSLSEFKTGLAQVQNSKAWNASTGTFDLGLLDMSWAVGINERWEQYKKKQEQLKKEQVKRALGELEGYDIVKSELGEWYLMKNGKKIFDKDYPELYAQLELCKNYLTKDQYSYEKIEVKKFELLYIPGVGGLSDIWGKGVTVVQGIIKASGSIKLGKDAIDKLNNSPSISLSTEKDLKKVLDDAVDTTKNKRGNPKNYEKDGDFEDALDDFDSLNLDDVRDLGNDKGKMGILEDGRKAIVRPSSKSGGPTLEIQSPDGNSTIKIRYRK